MDALEGNKVKIWQNLRVLHFDPASPLGQVMLVVKCEQPLDKFTVQVSGYCIHGITT